MACGNPAELDDLLKQLAQDFELMGVGVVGIQNHEIVYEGYCGWAVHENETPFSRDSVVRIASPSKTVTTIALMQLCEQNLLNLDDDVSDYLGWQLRNPHWPNRAITLRMLLGHTASLADGEGYANFSKNMVAERLSIRMLFSGTDGQTAWRGFDPEIFSTHEPGSFFAYSNAAWGLIASIIELVSGDRFDTYIRKNVLAPLGIEASFNVSDLNHHRVATLYGYENDDWVPRIDKFFESPPRDLIFDGYSLGQNGLIYGPQGGLRISARGLMSLADVLLNSGTTAGLKIDSMARGGEVFWPERTAVQLLEAGTFATMCAEHWRFDGSNGDTWSNFWRSYGLGLHRVTATAGQDVIFPETQMIGHPGIAHGLLSGVYVDPSSGSGLIFISTGSKKEPLPGQNSSFHGVEEAVFELLQSMQF